MKYRLTEEAGTDIADILRQTKKLFGPKQVSTYAKLIDDCIAMIAAEPSRPSSSERNDLKKGVRSFHLELVNRRRHSASHLVYYTVIHAANGDPEVIVIRVLHESMEPRRRLVRALRRQETH